MNYDLAIDVSCSKSALGAFIVGFSGARFRVGLRGRRDRWFNVRLDTPAENNKYRNLPAFVRAMDLEAQELFPSLVLSPDEKEKGKNLRTALLRGRDPAAPVVGIFVGGRKSLGKRWPEENFIELITALQAKAVNVIVFVGPEERDVMGFFKQKLPPTVPLVVEPSVRMFASLVSNCDLFIACDSGPVHLACALRVRTIAILLLPHNFDRWAPPPSLARVVCQAAGSSAKDVMEACHAELNELCGEREIPEIVNASSTLFRPNLRISRTSSSHDEVQPQAKAHKRFRIWSILFLALSQGCVTYESMPLDQVSVAERLAPPSIDAIRIQAKDIQHPILKPIEFDVRDGLSPDNAAILAVIANPKLRAIRDQRKLAAAQLLQAGILPNPQFSYSLGIPTGGMTQGTVSAYNYGLNWEITTLISRGAKIAAASADAVSVDLDVAWQEWQAAQAAKLHVYHLGFLDQRLAVARQEEAGLKENLDRVGRAVELGFLTRIDLAAADAALQRMHTSVLTTEQQREEERLAVNQSLGFSDEQNMPLQQNLEPPALKTLPAAAQLIEGIEERRLDLLALKSGYQAQEARLRAAILSQFPKINIGFVRARDNTDVISTGFGIAIDLPLFDRNQGAIAVENATRTKLFDEYVARLFEARGEVARILADMNSLQRQAEAAENSIPILQNVVESYRIALLQGNADVLTYYNARADLITKRLELVDLKRQLADMHVALEIAAGRYLER